MKKEKIRSEIFQMISQINDESFLEEIFVFVKNLEIKHSKNQLNEPHALYKRVNDKVDFSELHHELKMRSMAVSAGEFITQEDLENESENW